MHIQSEGDGEDEQGIHNLFIGTIMHLCSKTKGNMKARCNAEEAQNNKLSNESEKEDESWDEVSYNHNEDKTINEPTLELGKQKLDDNSPDKDTLGRHEKHDY